MEVSAQYRKYVLYMLTGAYIFNFIDRQIVVILAESIKEDLSLTDTDLGLLTGLVFALFYVSVGLPIARLADKKNRKKIISISMIIWSIMTALSGMAQNFVQLLLARIGVGIGEAGCSPPAHSIISDYYPANKRATALSIYSMGIYIGVLIGYLCGGWLNEFFGWRLALMAVGLPGIVYALILAVTVKEPIRGMSDTKSKDANYVPTLAEVARTLWHKMSFKYLALGAGFNAFISYGVGNWSPSYLVRIHDMSSGEIGTWLSLSAGFGGAFGIWLGGYLGDKYGNQSPKWYLLIPAITLILSIPVFIIMLVTSNKWICLLSIASTKILWTLYLAPCIAVTHGMVNIRMRALASAVFLLVLNLVGLGMGPTIIGAISDHLSTSVGTESLRYALSVCIVMSLLAAACYVLASKSIDKDLKVV